MMKMRYLKIAVLSVLMMIPMVVMAEVVTVKTTKVRIDKSPESDFFKSNGNAYFSNKLPMPIQITPPTPLEFGNGKSDFPYGALQRGFYLTALQLALSEAEVGDPAAQTLIGHIYETGRAVDRDEVKARQWYEIAAKSENPEAELRLGQYYLYGRGGLEKDSEMAAILFTKSSDRGNLGAKLNLGILHMNGEGVNRDVVKAEQLLEEVANRDIPEAQYVLGAALLDGELGTPDLDRAAHWLEQAALNGNINAQVQFGVIKFQGRGVDADEEIGANWLLKAAEAGNVVAMNRVSRLLLFGKGLETNIPEAAKWHLIARQFGLPDQELDIVLDSLTEEQLAEANNRAIQWLNYGFIPRQ